MTHARSFYARKKFFTEGWSLDACVGRALKEGLFTRNQIVYIKTLYGYTTLGLLGIKNINLPEKLRKSPKKEQTVKTSGSLAGASRNLWHP